MKRQRGREFDLVGGMHFQAQAGGTHVQHASQVRPGADRDGQCQLSARCAPRIRKHFQGLAASQDPTDDVENPRRRQGLT